MPDVFASCDLTSGFTLPCNVSPVAGTDDELILLNYNRIDRNYPKSTINNAIFTDIIRKFGGEGYLIQGRNNSIQGTSTTSQGTFITQTEHGVNFQTFGVSPKVEKVLNELKYARVVAVYKVANGWYRVAGANGGLLLNADNHDSNNAENGGGNVIELLGNRENQNVNYLADTYAIDANGVETYDVAATAELFRALLDPVKLNLTGVSAGANPVLTLASTAGVFTGDKITIEDITWGTEPTAPGNLLNDNSYVIEVVSATQLRITSAIGSATFNTTGGVYGSGGTIRAYRP